MAIILPSVSVPRSVQSLSSEAVPIPFPGSNVDPLDHHGAFGHISLNRRVTRRDLPPTTQDRMIALSFLAWRTNPMAKRLIEMEVDFTLGGGLTLTSDDQPTLDVITDFWNNDYNNWPAMIYQRLRDLLIYGEWLQHPLVSESGNVLIRDVQPDVIRENLHELGNHSKIDAVVFKKQMFDDGHEEENVSVPTIRRRVDAETFELDDAFTGEVFFFGINRSTDSLRGVGELFPLIDYIDLYDEVLFGRAEKIISMSHVYFDLTLEGMDRQTMEEYVRSETNIPPLPGSVYAHNPSAKLEQVTPDLNSDDHVEDVRVLKSNIVSGYGWPGTFFDDPGSAGRAVGAEMAEPALKMILSRQKQLRLILEEEMEYVAWVAKTKGRIASIGDFHLSFTRPSMRDLQRIGPALARLSQFIETMQIKSDVLSQDEARQIAISQINQLGLTDTPLAIEMTPAAGERDDDSDSDDDEVESQHAFKEQLL